MKLSDLLTMDMSTATDWLEENSDKYYLAPKTFMSDWNKELVGESAEAVNTGAPRGEILDCMDFNEDMLFALNTVLEE